MAILKIYEHDNYGGACWEYNVSSAFVGPLQNDRMSSFHLQSGYSLIFYRHAHYAEPLGFVRGQHFTIPYNLQQAINAGIACEYGEDSPGLAAPHNDQLSSLKLFGPDGIQL